MKKLFKALLKILLWILSILPTMAFSNDENYGTIELNLHKAIKSQLKCWRFSLFQIMLGANKIYILSLSRQYNDNKSKITYKWQILKLLSLDSLFDQEKDNSKNSNEYYKRITDNSFPKDRIENEKECLKYHIGNEKQRLESANNKVTIYMSVVLMIIPIVLGFNIDNLIKLISSSNWGIIIFIMLSYCFINIVLYILQYIKIRCYSYSSFNDLKNEKEHSFEQLTALYYYDYQSIKTSANMFVSYIKNIQMWIISAFSICTFVVLFIGIQSFSNSNNKNDSNSKSQVLNININDLCNPLSNSSIEITRLQLAIQTHDTDKIIIMYNDKAELSKIEEKLNDYKEAIEIQLVFDSQLEDNRAKILVYRGE